MPKQVRHKTKYPGVYYIDGTSVDGKSERIFYIRYRDKSGKGIDEKVGKQYQDNMTPAKAAQRRTERICGGQSNKEKREEAIKTSQKWTINNLWEHYRENRPDIKAIAIDEVYYKTHIGPKVGNKEPSELAPFDVDRLRLGMLKAGKAPATALKALGLLRRIIRYGEKKRLCQGLSFTIEMPRVDNQKTEDLTGEQLQRLLQAIDEEIINPQAAHIMLMALYTGMRRGEMFNLKWDDIDFERGFIHIRDPKGGKDAMIPLNESARELLHKHPRTGSLYVFPGRGGIKRTTIQKQVNKIKDRAGLPKDFRALHGLRHVYASMLASSGQVDMYTLQKLLTHKSPLMTQRYSHLRDDALRRASNLAGDLIGEATKQKGLKLINGSGG